MSALGVNTLTPGVIGDNLHLRGGMGPKRKVPRKKKKKAKNSSSDDEGAQRLLLKSGLQAAPAEVRADQRRVTRYMSAMTRTAAAAAAGTSTNDDAAPQGQAHVASDAAEAQESGMPISDSGLPSDGSDGSDVLEPAETSTKKSATTVSKKAVSDSHDLAESDDSESTPKHVKKAAKDVDVSDPNVSVGSGGIDSAKIPTSTPAITPVKKPATKAAKKNAKRAAKRAAKKASKKTAASDSQGSNEFEPAGSSNSSGSNGLSPGPSPPSKRVKFTTPVVVRKPVRPRLSPEDIKSMVNGTPIPPRSDLPVGKIWNNFDTHNKAKVDQAFKGLHMESMMALVSPTTSTGAYYSLETLLNLPVVRNYSPRVSSLVTDVRSRHLGPRKWWVLQATDPFSPDMIVLLRVLETEFTAQEADALCNEMTRVFNRWPGPTGLIAKKPSDYRTVPTASLMIIHLCRMKLFPAKPIICHRPKFIASGLALGLSNTNFPDCWGNTVPYSNMDSDGTAVTKVLPDDRSFIGPTHW